MARDVVARSITATRTIRLSSRAVVQRGAMVEGWYCVKKTGFQRSHGITEKEDLRIRRRTIAYSTLYASDIRPAVGTPLTQCTVRNQLL
ncbi:hypothetical protein TNCV_2293221 [Trichonephila clavipes]|nr:hypothetical protein TNCV_2293221 [Trichonephila clavipes]